MGNGWSQEVAAINRA